MKKKELLSVKEFAAELRMNLKPIHRANRKKGDPHELVCFFPRCCAWIHKVTSGYI